MPELAESQSLKYLTHNLALRVLDALVQASVIDKDLSDAPALPSDGDCYIVGPSPSSGDDWDGHESEIAYYRSSTWVFITPQEGFRVWVLDEDAEYVYRSASEGWGLALEAFYYDVGGGCNGAPTASQVLLRAIMVRGVSFLDDFAGSQAKAEVAATAQTDFDVQVNGVSIGYFRFAAAGTTATFVTTDSVTEALVAGDVLKVIAPGSPDATLANIAFTLKGTKA